MARSRSARRKQARDTLLGKGVTAAVMGVALLIAPAFAGNSPMLRMVFNALQSLGWLALLLGVLLLGIRFLVKVKSAAENPLPEMITPRQHKARYRAAATPVAPTSASAFPPSSTWKTGAAVEEPAEPRRRFLEKPPRYAPTGSPQTSTADMAAPSKLPCIWSPAVFAAIEWRRFEAVCETLFAQAGFRTKSQSHGADGGVDVWLYSANAEGPAAIAQCKHWRSKPVGVKEVREFFGVMASHQLKLGTFATTSSFTPDATAFAKANGVNAMDGTALLRLIGTRTPEQQQALLDVAFEGEYWRPTCASCGIKTVERERKTTREKFWGCSSYPRCKSNFPITAPIA